MRNELTEVIRRTQLKHPIGASPEIYADSIIAALPDMVQLEWWEPCKSNNYTHGAKTIFGTYYVGQCGGRSNAHAEFFHESGDIEQFLGPDRGSVIEAQQDARRHYAGRILSAFGITEGET